MIEKVKLNEVAKDLNISGKDLTALLQQRFGGEAKKPQTVLSGEELNFVMEHYTQQHAVKDFGEYFKLGEKKPAPAAAPKPAEKPAEKPVEKAAPAPAPAPRPAAPAPRPQQPAHDALLDLGDELGVNGGVFPKFPRHSPASFLPLVRGCLATAFLYYCSIRLIQYHTFGICQAVFQKKC